MKAEEIRTVRYSMGDRCPHRVLVTVGDDYCFWDCPDFIDRTEQGVVVCHPPDAAESSSEHNAGSSEQSAGDSEHNAACPDCGGSGRLDFPNISGHDYSGVCSLCRGRGVFPPQEEPRHQDRAVKGGELWKR